MSAVDQTIRVSAVVVWDERGRLLTVRKQGTVRFMLPGGKPEAGESAAACAIRECREEVGAVLDPQRLQWLGRFVAPAANEAGFWVESQVFVHPPVPVLGPAAEIAELRWMMPAEAATAADVAPMLRDHVVAALKQGHRPGEPGASAQ